MLIRKRLKIYTVPVLLIRVLLLVGDNEVRFLRKAKRSSVTRVYVGPRNVVTTAFLDTEG